MNIEKQIEFDKIKELWMELAITEAARERIRRVDYYLSEGELRKELRDTTDGRNLMETLGTPPLQEVSHMKTILAAAGKGECLTPFQLEKTEIALAAFRRLKDYLKKGRQRGSLLACYEENLDELAQEREEISRQIRGGQVDDYASRELSQIRGQIARCEEQMKQKAEQIIRSNKDYMADNYCTFRNGRLCVPVKKEYKLKVSGSVIDKSASGNTLFMEPSGVARYYEQLEQLKIREENEVYRILYTLTSMIDSVSSIILENIRVMERLDFTFSKGKLSLELDGTEPHINTGRRIQIKDGRHPLMDRKRNVPLQFQIGGPVQGIVITGPNTGGKTVAIKTVMLNCMMAQCGLHIPCKEADICMNSSYLCDIGDGQNLSENLSTFSAHMKRVLEILKEADSDSFIIMDELGSGTDPVEGMGIATAILEELRKCGALFLVTTHYTEVKEYADRTSGIINAKMTFDKESLEPTYQMVIGQAGESCAFYIADRLGMPREMLEAAVRASYGEDAVSRYSFQGQEGITKTRRSKLKKIKEKKPLEPLSEKYNIGDCVMVYPDRKLGIVCQRINEKGILRVQMKNKKIWINHKRVKLHVAAKEMYPEDYDFSILFETVENRKLRHDMERKYTEGEILIEKD